MKLRKLLVAVLAVFAGLAQAQQMPPIPSDPDVRVGKLDNGLTYYIRHNNWPENRADFYIAQKVGSIQEEESQRGLAHFLEHMCFNGTKHFPGNEVMRYCESIGVKFGADLNAYTYVCLSSVTGRTLCCSTPRRLTRSAELSTRSGVCAPVLLTVCSSATCQNSTQDRSMASASQSDSCR